MGTLSLTKPISNYISRIFTLQTQFFIYWYYSVVNSLKYRYLDDTVIDQASHIP